MNKRSIGKDYVGEIGFGGMSLSQFYGAAVDTESLKVLDKTLELGCNLWDTADLYGAGHNETLFGQALKGRRDKVFLASKFGNVYDKTLTSHQDQVRTNAPWIVDGTPEYIKKCIDLSLKRLKVDHIDLYYLHRVDPLTPIEVTVGAMAELVKAGKVRYLGLSEAAAETILRATKVHHIAAVQSEYSIWSRDMEEAVIPMCRKLKIAFVPYSPLGRGFLGGNIGKPEDLSEGDWRAKMPRFQAENLKANLKIVEEIKKIALKYGATNAQVALAWVLSRGADLIPIPGTKRIKYLEENAAASALKLDTADIEALCKLRAEGERHSELNRKFING